MNRPILTLVLSATACVAAHADSFSGNLSLASDYRFRGLSQTWKQPAVQGGVDYGHSSGAYAGTWLSSVSRKSYNNGAGLEWDLYGGWKFSPNAGRQDLTLDLGALAYVYPGARLNSAPGVATRQKYTNVDLYAGLAFGAFSARLSLAATDYFGLDSTTAAYAYFSALPARGSSRGSAYLDLGYTAALGEGWTLTPHLGRMQVRRYGELSYTDWKLALARDFPRATVTAALVGSDARRDFYQVADSAGRSPRRAGATGLVLTFGKTF